MKRLALALMILAIALPAIAQEGSMPAYIDIAARDLTSYAKGDIVGIAIEGKQCSISPSNAFICLIISDATRDQVHHYINQWTIDFRHVYVSENDNGWRYRIEVDPIYISASNVGKQEMKTEMVDLIENGEYWEGCSVFKVKIDYITIDIPKNGVYQTASGLSDFDYLKLLKSDFSDVFRARLDVSRYHFSDADVDTVIADGGTIELTKLQALNRVLDKLED
jgi:hypothetical protein